MVTFVVLVERARNNGLLFPGCMREGRSCLIW